MWSAGCGGGTRPLAITEMPGVTAGGGGRGGMSVHCCMVSLRSLLNRRGNDFAPPPSRKAGSVPSCVQGHLTAPVTRQRSAGT